MNKDQLLLKHLNLNDCKGYVTSDGRLYKAIINALEEAINYTLSCERDSELLPKRLSNEAYKKAQVMSYAGFVEWWDEQQV